MKLEFIVPIIIFLLTTVGMFTFAIHARPTRAETVQLISKAEDSLTTHLKQINKKLDKLDKDNTIILLKMVDMSLQQCNKSYISKNLP